MKNATKLATEYETALQTMWFAEKCITTHARKVPKLDCALIGWHDEMEHLCTVLRRSITAEKALHKEMMAHPTAWDKNVQVKITSL